MTDTRCTELAAIPARYAQPDKDTLAYLPKGGAQLAYMGHGEVTLALLEVDPLWTWEPLAIDHDTGEPRIIHKGKRLIMWGYLTVLDQRRLCVGTCDDTKGDPEKELVGDLLRNGAMRFGIGTKLWSKATSADPAGRADTTRAPQRQSAPPSSPAASSITAAQKAKMHATFADKGISDRAAKLAFVVAAIDRDVESSSELSKGEAAKVIDALEAQPTPEVAA
jgi:hypothetical protein